MKKTKKMFFLSLITTFFLIVWTGFLPSWNTNKWFVSAWIHQLWFWYDIILIIFLMAITYGIYYKKKYVKFFSAVFYGMIVADWLINFLIWVYADYNLLELRFIISYIFMFVILIYFYWFTKNVANLK